ncbi:hypothetical protein [Victivallis vadensis]|uniref:Glycosyl hydrolase family 78 alpha-rhamnosidase N-terminal domain-containing protein n=1 Tax=Victivallis vadensis TaxID=172901 RepID=A0A2U1AX66_9BACT|nr:hypothetical protein [Victivallis vadensis]PVY40951.1 hypothetical protein C8D82_1152 [Victivallis vadensis]
MFYQEELRWAREAEALKPHLIHEMISTVSVVRTEEDSAVWQGWKIRPIASPEDIFNRELPHTWEYTFDFGRFCVGFPVLDFEFIGLFDAPFRLEIKMAETPCELARDFSSYHGDLGRSWLQEALIVEDVAVSTIRLPRRYAFRYLKLRVVGNFTYKVILRNVRCDTVSAADWSVIQPLGERYDELDHAIYRIGLTTLASCMQESFEDGPKRDRRLWLGDLRLQALANYNSFRNYNLVKRYNYEYEVDDLTIETVKEEKKDEITSPVFSADFNQNTTAVDDKGKAILPEQSSRVSFVPGVEGTAVQVKAANTKLLKYRPALWFVTEDGRLETKSFGLPGAELEVPSLKDFNISVKMRRLGEVPAKGKFCSFQLTAADDRLLTISNNREKIWEVKTLDDKYFPRQIEQLGADFQDEAMLTYTFEQKAGVLTCAVNGQEFYSGPGVDVLKKFTIISYGVNPLLSAGRNVGRIDNNIFHAEATERTMRLITTEARFIYTPIFSLRIIPLQMVRQFNWVRVHAEVFYLVTTMSDCHMPALLVYIYSAINHLTFERYRATFFHG